MVETLNISVSGPAFSLLLYDNARSDYNQEGFLLGDVIENETHSLTDNDAKIVKKERIIKINAAIPCPNIGYFYNAAGKVDKDKIEGFLGEKTKKIVAWFKFKRANAFKLTFREKIVHKNLAKSFDIPENLFTCCLLTSSPDKISTTHLYSQIFIRYNEMSFQNLPMRIVNLSDPSHMYKNPEPTSESFNKLYQSLGIDSKSTQSINVITKINSALEKRTDELGVQLSEAEGKLHEMEEKIRIYQEKLREKNNLKCVEPIENGSNVDAEEVSNKKKSPKALRGKRRSRTSSRV